MTPVDQGDLLPGGEQDIRRGKATGASLARAALGAEKYQQLVFDVLIMPHVNYKLARGDMTAKAALEYVRRLMNPKFRPPAKPGEAFRRISDLFADCMEHGMNPPLIVYSPTVETYSVVGGVVKDHYTRFVRTDPKDSMCSNIVVVERVLFQVGGEVLVGPHNIDRVRIGIDAILEHIGSEMNASSMHWVSIAGLAAFAQSLEVCSASSQITEEQKGRVDKFRDLLIECIGRRIDAVPKDAGNPIDYLLREVKNGSDGARDVILRLLPPPVLFHI